MTLTMMLIVVKILTMMLMIETKIMAIMRITVVVIMMLILPMKMTIIMRSDTIHVDKDDPLQSDIDEFTDALLDDVGEVMTNNSRIFTCIVFGLLMAVALPVIGVLWCCFCKSRGERSPVKDSDRFAIKISLFSYVNELLFGALL